MENLERKIEKPDWKQKLPIYGIYQLYQDSKVGKPLITVPSGITALNSGRLKGRHTNPMYNVYQASSIAITTIGLFYGLAQLLQ
jgi:hypothetical protein